MTFRREQVVRLIEEQLRAYGLERSLGVLEVESRVVLEVESVSRLRGDCEANQVERVLGAVEELITDLNVLRRARQLILQHQYTLLLQEGRTMEAMSFLQHQLTPISSNKEIRQMTGMLMAKQPTVPDLFKELSSLLPIEMVVPERRLEVLLSQAKAHQVDDCDKHQSNVDLMFDEQCHHNRQTSFELVKKVSKANAEIWSIQFSHDGSLLAYGCTDKTVHILSIGDHQQFQTQLVLADLPSTPAIVSFSPDDSTLFIGFDEDGVGWLWSVSSKTFCWKITGGRGVSSMAWIRNHTLVCADQVRPVIRMYSLLHKREEHRWIGIQAASLCAVCYVSGNQSMLIVAEMCSNRLYAIDVDDHSVIGRHEIPGNVHILGMTANKNTLLVSCDDSKLRMIDIVRQQSDTIFATIRELCGHTSEKKVFSQPDTLSGSHVLLGSEDGRVYVYRLVDQCISCILGMPTNIVVTCVACHPCGSLVASGDDHGVVRVYLRRD